MVVEKYNISRKRQGYDTISLCLLGVGDSLQLSCGILIDTLDWLGLAWVVSSACEVGWVYV